MSFVLYFLAQFICAAAFRYAYHVSAIYEQYRLKSQKITYNRKGQMALLGAYLIYMLIALSRRIFYDTGGIDAVYYRDFYVQATGSFAEFSQICTQEIGFRFLMWSMSRLGLDFRALLFVVHSLCFVSICEFNKYMVVSKEGFVSFLCSFLICSELFYAFCLLRNEMAIAISMYFFVLLAKKKYRQALIPMVLALSCHISSVILVVVYFGVLIIEKLKLRDLKRVLLLLGLVLLAEAVLFPLTNIFVRKTKYSVYIDNGGIAWGVFAFVMVLSVTILLSYPKLCKKSRIRIDMLIVLAAWSCLPLQMNYGIMYRSLMFFMPMLYKILPILYNSMGKFPVRAEIVDRTLYLEIDLLRELHITKDNWKHLQTYIPSIKTLLKVATIGYLLIRLWKLYTVDFVAYGLYPYVLFFMN